MAFLDHVRRCNRHDLASYRPVEVTAVGGEDRAVRVGWIRNDRLDLLQQCAAAAGSSGFLTVEPERVLLRATDQALRTAALAALAEELGRRGEVRLTGELYAVRPWVGGPRLALLDRGAASWFGVAATGVHVNGFVGGPGGVRMWIAHRARGKSTFPGMLDNMVAGGQPDGISPGDNVLKECAEEAGIPRALAATARPVGAVSYVFENESGLKPDTMFCYDLELPADFEPSPVDGEVERFELLPIEEVAAIVRETDRFKFNCNLVVLDFLIRHGWLRPEDPGYPALVAGLRRLLPGPDGLS